ncbi:HTH-type transcriptional regulator/antitoxin HigA [Rhizobium tibeticum]|nr:HTH-type transcriptional regulator/antitoxin HigA [Rhizobium tibeticum]
MLNLKAFRTLRSEDEYNAALKEVRPYFENEPDEGSNEAAHFDALVLLIEAKHYPIPTATPVEAVKSVMVATNYSRADQWQLVPKRERLIF